MITLQDIKTHGAKAISDNHPTWLIVNSKPKCVLVPPEEFEMLVDALETLEDIQACDERKHEKGIPMEEFFEKYFPKSRRKLGKKSGKAESHKARKHSRR